MAYLESLPADQRAVLQLVLQRGRSYDDIAALLSIDRAAVRERALSALDAIGPETAVDSGRRALITDYLLGQLPSRVGEEVRGRLASSPAERSWARVVASELAALAAGPLPEIPPAAAPRAEAGAGEPEPRRRREPRPVGEPRAPRPAGTSAARRGRGPELEPAEAAADTSRTPADEDEPFPLAGDELPDGARPGSRAGGAALLAAAVVVVVVIVLVVALSGGSSSHSSSSASASASASASSSAGASASASSSANGRPVAQVNLFSPTGNKKVTGVAIVVKQNNQFGVIVRAQGVTPNTRHDAYAVWLYNSPSDNKILGFVNPGVSSNGVLQTMGVLPAGASHYKQLLVSLETQPKPRAPSQIVLQGALSVSG